MSHLPQLTPNHAAKPFMICLVICSANLENLAVAVCRIRERIHANTLIGPPSGTSPPTSTKQHSHTHTCTAALVLPLSCFSLALSLSLCLSLTHAHSLSLSLCFARMHARARLRALSKASANMQLTFSCCAQPRGQMNGQTARGPGPWSSCRSRS